MTTLLQLGVYTWDAYQFASFVLLLVLQCPHHLSLYNLHAYDIISLCAGQFQKISPEYTSLNYTCQVSCLQIKNFTSRLLTHDGKV